MNKDQSEKDHDVKNHLRQQAEAILRGQPVDLSRLPIEDIQSLLHELQVHQVELTLQNEELRQTRQELEIARDRSADLYNFAPAGYCTLDDKDRIVEVNQTLAALLSIEHEQLLQKSIVRFIDHHSQDEFYFHRQRTLAGPRSDGGHHSQVSEILMVRQTGERIDVLMESIPAPGRKNNMWVMIRDITDQRRLEKQAQERAIQQEVQHRLIDKVEQERQKLARDLHNGPLQDLIAVNMGIAHALNSENREVLLERMSTAQEALRQHIGEVRRFCHELRPPTLEPYGLEKAIRSHAGSFAERHPELKISLTLDRDQRTLPETSRIALFRIYQESLVNVLKHAQASIIQV